MCLSQNFGDPPNPLENSSFLVPQNAFSADVSACMLIPTPQEVRSLLELPQDVSTQVEGGRVDGGVF